jgi:hypothetical protein
MTFDTALAVAVRLNVPFATSMAAARSGSASSWASIPRASFLRLREGQVASPRRLTLPPTPRAVRLARARLPISAAATLSSIPLRLTP